MKDIAGDQLASLDDTRVEPAVESKTRPSVEALKGRYAIGKLIGSGGMAAVYQATDLSRGREVALKQFTLPKEDRHYRESAGLFEQEFLTLAQLSHPRIIEVYDYAVDETGPYYTMELLDGGDLRERAPMPWRDACAVAYDVCSSLALMHARRLVHRDVSPRNIRCTRDGKAKLIDFGALVPMGPCDVIVGTPQFVSPEVVHRSALDARTDLFSLGATLYYALTGRVPYPVKKFHELADAWEVKPQPPSRFVPDIPPALDSLVLWLISIEPASRPHGAYEVMQHLAAIADLTRVEADSVARAYLSTPTMVGREGLMKTLHREVGRTLAGRGGAFLIQAAAGAGRSRVLDATALAAKAHGTMVLRAHGGTAAKQAFKTASALVEHLADAAPELTRAAACNANVEELLFEGSAETGVRLRVRELTTLEKLPRVTLQDALGRLFLAVTKLTPLAIAIDDVHRVDEPSLAFLAALASQAERKRLFLVTTAELDADPTDRVAFGVLRLNSTRFSLKPLNDAEVAQLFVSLFGDVPNLRLVTERVQAVAHGNPRACMDLAQHLADKALVRYEGGAWTLPARLDPSDLPASVDAELRARIAALSPLARFFAEAHALATHPAFTRDDYARLRSDATARERDAAIGALVSSRLVVSDGRIFTVANESCRMALSSSLDAPEAAERHRALIDVHAGKQQFGVVRHAFAAGLDARGLDALGPSIPESPETSALTEAPDLDAKMIAETFSLARDAAVRLGRPARDVAELGRWLCSLGVAAGARYFEDNAPAWRARLELDSGYADYQAHPEIADRAERLSNAMRLAYERYFATPEQERVYRPDEAVGGLVRYVAIAIAHGTTRIDAALIESLPGLLEPFAPLNEFVDVIWKNALACRETMCRIRPERARVLWMEVFERLGTITSVGPEYVTLVRNAVAFGLGTCEAWLGMPSAIGWAEKLDDDPMQGVSALQLRRTVRVQLGDWEGAERLRKQAEVLALQAHSRQMFQSVLQIEINAFAMAGDMTALKHATDRARALAENTPGWVPTVLVAEARFQILCSNFETALASVESALALLESKDGPVYPLGNLWCGAVAARLEALIGLGRHEDAKRIGTHAVEFCEKFEIGSPSHDISRMLALAEGRLGEHERAAARLSQIISEQLALGISGLKLGASYEARARIAIWANDASQAEDNMRHTAREYRYGHGSALGARYERLVREAAPLGGAALPNLSDFGSTHGTSRPTSNPTTATRMVINAMKGMSGTTERAERALDLLCDERAAAGGYLYLFHERRPRLVATRGLRRPSPEFTAFMARFLDNELAEDEDLETRVVSGPLEEPDLAAMSHIDSAGLELHPRLLRGILAEGPRYAGVVVFAYQGVPPRVDDGLLVALSAHFIESGDSDTLEPGDWQTEVDELPPL